MAKITAEQRKWWHWEFEDFSFKGDLVSGELSVDGPIPVEVQGDDFPKPQTIMEVQRVIVNGDEPRAVAVVTIDGPRADLYFSDADRAELFKRLEEKMEDEAVDYLERHQYDP